MDPEAARSDEACALDLAFRKDAQELLESMSKELLLLDHLVQAREAKHGESAHATSETAWKEARDLSLRSLFQSNRSLKSLSGTFGYLRVSACCGALEELLRALRLLHKDLTSAAMKELFVCVDEVQDELTQAVRVVRGSWPPPQAVDAASQGGPDYLGMARAVHEAPPFDAPEEGVGRSAQGVETRNSRGVAGDGVAGQERSSMGRVYEQEDLQALDDMLQAADVLLGARSALRDLAKRLHAGESARAVVKDMQVLQRDIERHAGSIRRNVLTFRRVPADACFDAVRKRLLHHVAGVANGADGAAVHGRAPRPSLRFQGGNVPMDAGLVAALAAPMATWLARFLQMSRMRCGFDIKASRMGEDLMLRVVVRGQRRSVSSLPAPMVTAAETPATPAIPATETASNASPTAVAANEEPRRPAGEGPATRAASEKRGDAEEDASWIDAWRHMETLMRDVGGTAVQLQREDQGRAEPTWRFVLRMPQQPGHFRALLVETEQGRFALPLALVQSVERFDAHRAHRLHREHRAEGGPSTGHRRRALDQGSSRHRDLRGEGSRVSVEARTPENRLRARSEIARVLPTDVPKAWLWEGKTIPLERLWLADKDRPSLPPGPSMPVVSMTNAPTLERKAEGQPSSDFKAACFRYVVVAGRHDAPRGWLVSEVIGEEDVALRPMSDRAHASPGCLGLGECAGASMWDQPVLVLDLAHWDGPR